MPKLTFIASIDLPEDVWENAEVVSRARPVQSEIEALLTKHELSGSVEASFDGRKATRSKVEAMVVDSTHALPGALEQSPIQEAPNASHKTARGQLAAE